MPRIAPEGRTHRTFSSFGAALLLAAMAACGGGNNPSHSADNAPLAISAPAALVLPVPESSSSQTYYYQPYSGTVTVAISRTGSVSGAVTMMVSGLPANVKATFAEASTSSVSDELTIQAGYPDPNDTTFAKMLYPTQGTYYIAITATAGTYTANATLKLVLGQETPDFMLSFLTPDQTYLDGITDLSVSGSAATSKYIIAQYVNSVGWATANNTLFTGPVTVAAVGQPAHMKVQFDTTSFGLQDANAHTVQFSSDGQLAAGTYAFYLTATTHGTTHTLPLTVTYSPAPFFAQPLLASAKPTVAQGGSITFPLYLGHDDAFFGTVEPSDGSDPSYVGDTQLAATNLPAGITVTFGNSDPTGLASVPVTVSASGSAAIDPSETFTVQATRKYSSSSQIVSTLTVPMAVTASVSALGAAPTLWVQAVEWGQTVLKPGLPLVAGKPALLRVQLMSDRGSAPAPVVTATLQDSTVLTLSGPATVPTAVTEGDLPTASAASGSSYTVVVPAAKVVSGLSATISGLGFSTVTVTPQVRAAFTLPLLLVPIVHKSVAPQLPTDTVISQELQMFWPLTGVSISHRPPYTTTTVIPVPNADPTKDLSGNGWNELLNELATLKAVDASDSYYFGFFNLGLTRSQIPSTGSIVGQSLLGEGVGMAIDEASSVLFQNTDSALDNTGIIMVHEMGHAFNLNHVPAGGAGWPQLDYPYANDGNAGTETLGDIGTWGYNALATGPLSLTAFDPMKNYDIMSYADTPHWVSDWDYLAAMSWLGGLQHSTGTLAYRAPAAAEHWVVSGWIEPSGQVHVSPLLRMVCPARPAAAGDHHAVLHTSAGDLDVAFAATQVPDLPAGHRQFLFTVPASGTVSALDLRTAGTWTAHRQVRTSLADRRTALAADAQAGTLVASEAGGSLHLVWDAALHPYVSVFHEGAGRTTLALHLTGGSADLPLDGLPAGGRFVIHYSDGLNAVVRSQDR